MTHESEVIIEKLTKEKELYYNRGMELAKEKTELLKREEQYKKELEDHKKIFNNYNAPQSPLTNEVFKAFSQAQGCFPSIAKDKQGYGYKYADFAVLLSTILPILSKFGLSFSQCLTPDNICHTRIQHASGQYFSSQYLIPFPTREEFRAENKKITYQQELGTIRTYTKKYEAFGILGIHPEDDTDGK